MKTPLLRLLLVSTLVLLAGNLAAAPLTNAEFRKFRGRYNGDLSGIAGQAGGSTVQVGPFPSFLVVSTRRVESLTPAISGLFIAPKHRIIWSKPTGTSKRVILKGTYRDTFINSFGTQFNVVGTRRVVLNDRGAAAPKRYAASLNDDLKETYAVSGATSAGQILKGILRKK